MPTQTPLSLPLGEVWEIAFSVDGAELLTAEFRLGTRAGQVLKRSLADGGIAAAGEGYLVTVAEDDQADLSAYVYSYEIWANGDLLQYGSLDAWGTLRDSTDEPPENALSGAAAGEGVAAGQLQRSFEIGGEATGEGTAAGDLDAVHSIHLSGTAEGEAVADGDLSNLGETDLVGAAAGVGAASADLDVGAPLAGEATGEGTAAGGLTNEEGVAPYMGLVVVVGDSVPRGTRGPGDVALDADPTERVLNFQLGGVNQGTFQPITTGALSTPGATTSTEEVGYAKTAADSVAAYLDSLGETSTQIGLVVTATGGTQQEVEWNPAGDPADAYPIGGAPSLTTPVGALYHGTLDIVDLAKAAGDALYEPGSTQVKAVIMGVNTNSGGAEYPELDAVGEAMVAGFQAAWPECKIFLWGPSVPERVYSAAVQYPPPEAVRARSETKFPHTVYVKGPVAYASFTGSISGTTLTVSAMDAGSRPILDGAFLRTKGASTPAIAANTYIVDQLTGTPGGAGTYQLSVSQTVASRAISAGYQSDEEQHYGAIGSRVVGASFLDYLPIAEARTAPVPRLVDFLDGLSVSTIGEHGLYRMRSAYGTGTAIHLWNGASDLALAFQSNGELDWSVAYGHVVSSFTASFSSTTMTVSGHSGAPIVAGTTVSGGGMTPAGSVTVVTQLTGTTGGDGTYQVSQARSGSGLTLRGGNTGGVSRSYWHDGSGKYYDFSTHARLTLFRDGRLAMPGLRPGMMTNEGNNAILTRAGTPAAASAGALWTLGHFPYDGGIEAYAVSQTNAEAFLRNGNNNGGRIIHRANGQWYALNAEVEGTPAGLLRYYQAHSLLGLYDGTFEVNGVPVATTGGATGTAYADANTISFFGRASVTDRYADGDDTSMCCATYFATQPTGSDLDQIRAYAKLYAAKDSLESEVARLAIAAL